MAYKAVDVAVIGGGPGGLAAAVALKNSAPKLKVGHSPAQQHNASAATACMQQRHHHIYM
jgi:2-polyprenyl-6-methoxyphenol hydroxylase-like FAD-dependent oxidoreductase